MKTEQNWNLTANGRPPEGQIVWTMDSGGHVSKLKRQGSLWFFPDGSMYVYYTPTHWKPL